MTFVVFWPSLANGFTNWDDHKYVLENPVVRDLTMANVKSMFSQPLVVNYHPLTMLSLSLNAAISGEDPFSYHLVNLICHLANVVLVFVLIWRLTAGQTVSALVTALLFAIHPMHVESVAWVSGRKDVLYSLFFLGGLIAYVGYVRRPFWGSYTAALGLFMLSLLSKPAAVVFPLVLFLIDYYVGRMKGPPRLSTLIFEKAPFLLLSLALGVVTLRIQSDVGAVGDIYSVPTKLLFAAYSLVGYLVKALLPLNLAAFYPYPPPADLPVAFYLAPLVVIGVAGAVYASSKVTRTAVWGSLFYLLNLALVLQFVTVGNALMADRYTYLPYIGLFFVAATGAQALWARNQGYGRTLLLGGVAVAAVLLGYGSFQRTKVWRNSETLWTDAIEHHPSPTAYLNRGQFYYHQRRLPEALADFEQAVARNSKGALGFSNRGLVYFELNRSEEALRDFGRAIELDPKDPRAFFNRGNLFLAKKMNSEAIADYRQALALNMVDARVYNNLGNAHFNREEYDQAAASYQRAMELNPGHSTAYINLGAIHYTRREYDLAIPFFDRALQLDPRDGRTHFFRSQARRVQGNRALALEDARRAQQLGFPVPESYLRELSEP